MLKKLKTASSPTEHLFVGTDLYMFFVVSWDPVTQEVRTEKSFFDLSDETSRDSPTHDRCLLDTANKYLVLHLYDGIVTAIPLEGWRRRGGAKILGEPVSARISDRFIRSSAFLHPRGEQPERTNIAFLLEDNQQKTWLKVRRLEVTPGAMGDQGHAELDHVTIAREDIDPQASHLIPVPAPICTYTRNLKAYEKLIHPSWSSYSC